MIFKCFTCYTWYFNDIYNVNCDLNIQSQKTGKKLDKLAGETDKFVGEFKKN